MFVCEAWVEVRRWSISDSRGLHGHFVLCGLRSNQGITWQHDETQPVKHSFMHLQEACFTVGWKIRQIHSENFVAFNATILKLSLLLLIMRVLCFTHPYFRLFRLQCCSNFWPSSSSISEISLTVAEAGTPVEENEKAYQIEKCDCPAGYSGLSCEVCTELSTYTCIKT